MKLEWRVKEFFQHKNIDQEYIFLKIEPRYIKLLENILFANNKPREIDFEFLEALAEAVKMIHAEDVGISDFIGFKKRIPPKYDDDGRDSAAWSRGN